ncbi:MAG TPA: magnesium transporter [Candidatus Binatia bacterium]|nr:magnesium transporter [Candidatus Binatia bacterium]
MHWEEFKEMFTAELVSITGGIAAGTLLAFSTNKLELIPGLFILMPGFLALRGSIAASLAARISSALHRHHHSAEHENSSFGKQNVHASFLLAIVGSLVLGLVAYLGTRLAFHINAPALIFVAVMAAFISNIILVPITFLSTIWLYKHGYDPDNIMGPYITTIGDIISIVSLLIAVSIL